MPPNRTSTGRPRGRPPKSAAAAASTSKTGSSSKSTASNRAAAAKSTSARRRNDEPSFVSAGGEDVVDDEEEGEEEAEDEGSGRKIPPELLTRLLHQFFQKEGTRITKDANDAVGKYVDTFVREAIARAASEAPGGFFDVADLEKIAPQLLLDL